MKKNTNPCHFCGHMTDTLSIYMAMCLPNEKMEKKIDKWGGSNWRENIERDDISEADAKELNDLNFYDQLLNTSSRCYCCVECQTIGDELFRKYYSESDEKNNL